MQCRHGPIHGFFCRLVRKRSRFSRAPDAFVEANTSIVSRIFREANLGASKKTRDRGRVSSHVSEVTKGVSVWRTPCGLKADGSSPKAEGARSIVSRAPLPAVCPSEMGDK